MAGNPGSRSAQRTRGPPSRNSGSGARSPSAWIRHREPHQDPRNAEEVAQGGGRRVRPRCRMVCEDGGRRAVLVFAFLCGCRLSTPSNPAPSKVPGPGWSAGGRPMNAPTNGGAVRWVGDSTGAGLGARGSIDYHAQCPKNKLNCCHWRGLTCGDVDTVMFNLSRYEFFGGLGVEAICAWMTISLRGRKLCR